MQSMEQDASWPDKYAEDIESVEMEVVPPNATQNMPLTLSEWHLEHKIRKSFTCYRWSCEKSSCEAQDFLCVGVSCFAQSICAQQERC